MGSDLINIDPADSVLKAACADHGPFDQKVTVILGREFKTGCPECARIRKEAEDASEIAEKAREERMRVERKLGSAMIPKRFTGRMLDNYQGEIPGQIEALRICRKYASRFKEISATGRCLLLLGNPGTGKTHLAVAIANEIMLNSPATAVYRTVGSLLQAIRASYDRASELTEAQILSGLIQPDLLILDEVGATKEKTSEFELTTLFAVINGRYEEQRPTIVVSNLGIDELPAAMGERCVDRLREGGGVIVPFAWESQRRKVEF